MKQSEGGETEAKDVHETSFDGHLTHSHTHTDRKTVCVYVCVCVCPAACSAFGQDTKGHCYSRLISKLILFSL